MRRLAAMADHLAASQLSGELAASQLAYHPLASQLVLSEEVASALACGRPVVALESTIISHGQPFPANVACALEVEAVVRENGAVPATIAVLGGRLHVGLSREQIEYLGRAGHKVTKCSRRDLAVVIARKLDGSTTVSATMIVAKMAGISVFVTGGIGGVHRDAPFDVSADLSELGRTGGMAVVCSGAKSILDIGATLEVLETQGVTVVTLGQKHFPAFFTRQSAFATHVESASLSDVAEMLRVNMRLKLGSGLLLAVPVPPEMEASGAVEEATEQAVEEAKQRGISGKDVTPFLLQRISDLTGAESLKSNIALIKNNARIGAQLACMLQSVPILVIGGAAMDVSLGAASTTLVLGESNIATSLSSSPGGVGRNLVECLARLSSGLQLSFASVVGRDESGERIVRELKHLGVDCGAVTVSDTHPTATYYSVLRPSGELAVAMAAMAIFDHALPNVVVDSNASPRAVVMDCNFSSDFIVEQLGRFPNAHAWIEPTSEAKCGRAEAAILQGLVYGIAPNEAEFAALGGLRLLEHVQVVICKRGSRGVLVHLRGVTEPLSFPAPQVVRVVSVSGAGDALLAAILVMLYDKREMRWDVIMRAANGAVAEVLQSRKSVAPTLRPL
jgi:pseudouridine-5'-phosphate glycosidase/sugar/nucleoside kinase (ribokinase family)